MSNTRMDVGASTGTIEQPRLDEATIVDCSRLVPVCPVGRLIPGLGVAALLPDGRQVAVFRINEDEFYALSNVDPFSRAAVLSRGITGDAAGVPFVASPMLKQRFDLRRGVCLDDESVVLRTYRVVVANGVVHVAV